MRRLFSSRFLPFTAFSISALAALVACSSTSAGGGGETTPGDAAHTCFDYAAYVAAPPRVSFTTEVLPILHRSCGLSTACHGNDATPATQPYFGASTTPTAADVAVIMTSLTEPSTHNAPMPIGTPGDPSQSFILYKLDGEIGCAKLGCAAKSACGTPMPQTGPSLPADQRETIRRWISQGMVNDFPGAGTPGSGGSGGA